VAAAVHPVRYYFAHPCEAVTLPEINAALGYPYPEYVSAGSSCPIGTRAGDEIIFTHETDNHFKSQNPGSVGSGPVPSLGHDAYCVIKPVTALIQSYVVTSLGTAGASRSSPTTAPKRRRSPKMHCRIFRESDRRPLLPALAKNSPIHKSETDSSDTTSEQGCCWCRRGDLNPHALAGTSPSSRIWPLVRGVRLA
jgi:hypothetical protein